jgi:hypothetical protein
LSQKLNDQLSEQQINTKFYLKLSLVEHKQYHKQILLLAIVHCVKLQGGYLIGLWGWSSPLGWIEDEVPSH